MKSFLILMLSILLSEMAFADTQQAQNVHQYIVVEAYNLLKVQLGYDIPVMRDHLGTTETGYGRFLPGGLIVIGAFREDEEDIVYGTGAPFGWNTSSTHFWDPDRGDNSHFISSPLNISYPNAYQKARKFIYGGYNIQVAYPGTPIIEEYEAPSFLPDYYKTGQIYYRGYYNEIGQFIARNKWVISPQWLRDRLTWEILGRVAHLLADVGTPAHAHNTQHDPIFGGTDSYEVYMGGGAYRNWGFEDALAQEDIWGGRIDVTSNSNPIKYLFYTVSQIAGHFPSEDDSGNNVWDINDPFSLYPPLEFIMSNLGAPPISVNVNDIASKSYVYSIRATAALFHWFASEAEILSRPTQPLSISISGPTTIDWGPSGESTWSASVSGGNQPYHYKWWYKYSGGSEALSTKTKNKKFVRDDSVHTNLLPIGGGYWSAMYIDSPNLTRYDYKDHYLKCVVTDADNTEVTSNIMYIRIRGGSALQLSTLTNGEQGEGHKYATVSESPITEDRLFYNYPNPFNPSTVIYFTLKSAGNVNLKVYNILGQKVAVLLNENKASGRYRIRFNGKNLPSGIYLYKLITDDYSATGKMNLMK